MDQLERRRRLREGISMIETVIAMSILAVGMLAMLAAQVTALQQGRWGRHTTDAGQIARDQMELILRLPWADPGTQPTAWTAPVAVTRMVRAPNAPAGGFQEQTFNLQWRITAAGFDPNLRMADVRVTWTEANQPPASPPRRYAMSSAKHNDP